MESYVHKGVFRTKSNIYDRAFFTLVKPYFKNVPNSIKLPQACNFIKKEPLAQVNSCEFCNIFKNTFSYRIHLVAAYIKC